MLFFLTVIVHTGLVIQSLCICHDRLTCSPVPEMFISTKRAFWLSGLSCRRCLMIAAACGSLAIMYIYPPPPAPGSLYPKQRSSMVSQSSLMAVGQVPASMRWFCCQVFLTRRPVSEKSLLWIASYMSCACWFMLRRSISSSSSVRNSRLTISASRVFAVRVMPV